MITHALRRRTKRGVKEGGNVPKSEQLTGETKILHDADTVLSIGFLLYRYNVGIRAEFSNNKQRMNMGLTVQNVFLNRPSSIVHHPSSIVHRPSSIVPRPSSIVHRSSSIINRSSSIIPAVWRATSSSTFLCSKSNFFSLTCLVKRNLHRQQISCCLHVMNLLITSIMMDCGRTALQWVGCMLFVPQGIFGWTTIQWYVTGTNWFDHVQVNGFSTGKHPEPSQQVNFHIRFTESSAYIHDLNMNLLVNLLV